MVAVVLFTAGSLFALLEGVDKLRHPHELGSWPWAVGTLAVAFALESFSLRTAVRESRELKGELPWTGFIRRAKVPELPVVLLEDTGALLGLAFALVGVGLAEVTGNARFDAAGSIAIGVLLGVIAMILVVEMKSLLIGEAASPEVTATIAHPPPHRAPRAGGPAGRGQDRRRRGAADGGDGAPDRPGRGRRPDQGAGGPPDVPRTRRRP